MRSGVLPLRPLTLGELLDAAVALLRRHARVFLGVGLLLAAAEQAVLYPLRRLSSPEPPFLSPYDDRLALYWGMFCVGMATEIAIVALLGGLTARAAGPALLGERLPDRRLLSPSGGRLGGVLFIALTVGTLGFITAAACAVPWIPVYALLGLSVPALVIDGVSPLRALGRSIGLSARAGLRAAGIRLVGYVAWLAVRFALGAGTIVFAKDYFEPGSWAVWLLAAAVWTGVNTIAYPVLACLDAVLHLETRMRTEGLDLALSRAAATGRKASLTLAADR